MGWAFRATIDRSRDHARCAEDTDRVLGWGAHGWRGVWLDQRILERHRAHSRSNRRRGRGVIGFRIRLQRPGGSRCEDPAAFQAAVVRTVTGQYPVSRRCRAMSWVTSRNDDASDVGTSITNGRVMSGNALMASRRSLDALDAHAVAADRAGDGGVVERVEPGGDRLLAHAVQDPAERAVVEHEDADRQVLLDRGHQRVDRHGEAAVAAHRERRAVRGASLAAIAAGTA